MIRKENNLALKNGRVDSTSNDRGKLKKSTSASSKNSSTLANSSMINSFKARVETSGNKKNNSLNTSASNRSLKALRENTNTKNMSSSTTQTSKKVQPDAKENKQVKKGAIMVKNIKSKIVGGLSSVLKSDKQNHFNKKKLQTEASNTSNSTKYNLTVNTPKAQKFKSTQSPLNSSLITKRDMSKRTSQNIQLSMDMFELGRKLGKGRFGDVFSARDLRSGFVLAIKIISKKELKESEMEAQLIQEIKIQMYCSHPNILKMYGFFADEHKIYLLLEMATNGCLFKEIRQKGYFQQDLACYYFRQVTSGIRYLHSNYAIHRDIKPQNILNCFNVLKICDFGWAIYSPIYQRQTFCGTLDYVPPEIVTGEFYDEKADIWCLGVLCYELCTGKAPFQSKTNENETYDKILKVQIEFPLYLSAKVVDFVGKILNRDPQKRITMAEIEAHDWMRAHENESGRMICKQIWDSWMKLTK